MPTKLREETASRMFQLLISDRSIPVSIKKVQLNKIGRSRRIHEGARQKTTNFLDALISQLRAKLLGPREVRDCFVLVHRRIKRFSETALHFGLPYPIVSLALPLLCVEKQYLHSAIENRRQIFGTRYRSRHRDSRSIEF